MIQRVLALPILLFGISVVVFFTVHLIPGNPAEILAGGVYATPQEVARVEAQYGLDKPLPQQYLVYLGNLAHGDFGQSLFAQRAVTAELADRLPASIELSFFVAIYFRIIIVGTPIRWI